MTDEETEMAHQIATALEGASLHEWTFARAASVACLIAESASGKRFSIQVTAYSLPMQPKGKEP